MDDFSDIIKQLQKVRWWLPGCDNMSASGFEFDEDSILPGLISVFESLPVIASKPGLRRKTEGFMSAIKRLIDDGWQLSVRLPNRSVEHCRSWLGTRLYLFRTIVRDERLVAVVSSRRERAMTDLREWLDRLRLSGGTCFEPRDRLIHVPQTSTAEWCDRCCELFQIAPLRVHLPGSRLSPERWCESILPLLDQSAEPSFDLFVSPQLSDEAEADLVAIPERDRLAMLLADQVRVVGLRRDGNLHRLLVKRLADERFTAGSVRLLMDEATATSELAHELHQQGAVLWYLSAKSEPAPTTATTTMPVTGASNDVEAASRENESGPVMSSVAETNGGVHSAKEAVLNELRTDHPDEWSWLTHCTREPRAEWPGETRNEYLDSLLLGVTEPGRSALESLENILRTGVLLATGEGLRDQAAMVCFSAVPLSQLPARRVWRTHRRRYDFEPFGICIRRDALMRRGARPVVYGDDACWRNLSDDDRPWFQKRSTVTRTQRIDWSEEREWRVPGPLPLRDFKPTELFVFCDSSESAARLQCCSLWPVIALTDWPPRST